jgi:hypothetical protein
MILRRLMLHVKEQNWFAVGLDFLIVVVGVFIGIQVSNWNDVRRDRQAESIYLDRLGREIAEISPQAEASHATVRGRLERIVEIRNLFASGGVKMRSAASTARRSGHRISLRERFSIRQLSRS